MRQQKKVVFLGVLFVFLQGLQRCQTCKEGVSAVLCMQISSHFVHSPRECASRHDLPPKILRLEASFFYCPPAPPPELLPSAILAWWLSLCRRDGGALLQLSAVTQGKLLVSIQTSEWIKIAIHQEASLALSFVMWLLYEAASSLKQPRPSPFSAPVQSTDAFLCVNGRESCLAHFSLVA